MRLDKYLKVSRIIKRRTVAKEICSAGRILVNGRAAKAGTDVAVADILTIRFGRKIMEVEILQIAETMRSELAADMYKVLKQTAIEDQDEF
jgi:ribosomal 50S subunit-recycling heat shock protein